MPRTVGRKGRRFLSSGGAQAFQFEQDNRGPSKLILSIASGQWAVFVQSQRRHRFLITIVKCVGVVQLARECELKDQEHQKD